jgi:hypothetical protein
MKKKELKVKFLPPSEPYDPENLDMQPLVDLCVLLIEADWDYHRKKLAEGPQFCDYCGKEIKELSDFYTRDEKNICLTCYEKISKEPGYQRRFCGIKIAE